MAMGNCRECGKEVSGEAKTCPHCGVTRPVASPTHHVAFGFGGVATVLLVMFVAVCSTGRQTPHTSAPVAPPSSSGAGCNASAAVADLERMRGPVVARVEEDAGWTIVTFGSDYSFWTARQTEAMVTTYADADACAMKQTRNLEFRSPSGKLVARADGLRGIQMK